MGGGVYARNSFERALDEAVTPPQEDPEETAFQRALHVVDGRERERQELAKLRAYVGNLPRHPMDYGTWSAVQLRAFIHAVHDEPPDPRVKR